MKKLSALLLSSALLLGAVGCSNDAKTATGADSGSEATAPNTSTEASPSASPQSPSAESAQDTQKDATSEVRKDQLNSDIRAREQRNNATGGDADRAEGDLASEVRSKLEANLPASKLAVDAEDGAVTVSGTVPTQEQLSKIDKLAKEIKGVKSVKVEATVAPAK